MDDPVVGEVGVYTRMQENGAPVLVATRLQVVDHRITQIESVIARASDFLQGGDTPDADVLGDAPRAQFLQVLPPASRRSRQEMIDIVNTYFTGIENNDGSRPPLFADDCNRIENGKYTTNRPKPAQGERSGCISRARKPSSWAITTMTRGCGPAASWRSIRSAGWSTPRWRSTTTRPFAPTSCTMAGR
ncbi:MAG: hypothetical protein WDO56_09195 [Gammaproteobacteria bacterium]